MDLCVFSIKLLWHAMEGHELRSSLCTGSHDSGSVHSNYSNDLWMWSTFTWQGATDRSHWPIGPIWIRSWVPNSEGASSTKMSAAYMLRKPRGNKTLLRYPTADLLLGQAGDANPGNPPQTRLSDFNLAFEVSTQLLARNICTCHFRLFPNLNQSTWRWMM